MDDTQRNRNFTVPLDITDSDVLEAMKEIGGYLDITPGDLKEIMKTSYRLAMRRIAESVRAADIMTKAVYSVNEETSLKEVADLMADRRISGVPVIDSTGHVTGVISEKDFIVRMGSKAGSHVMGVIAECMHGRGCLASPLREQSAKDVMTSPAITVFGEMTLFRIMELFTEKGINRVPVVDADNRLVGIISREDIIRAPRPAVR